MKGVDRIWSSCQPWYALSKIQSRTIATWSPDLHRTGAGALGDVGWRTLAAAERYTDQPAQAADDSARR